MDNNIGRKIKELRNSHKMTLKDLSGQTNFSISYLSQVERGAASISVHSLNKIADVLGVELAYFLDVPASHQRCVMRSYEQSVLHMDDSDFIYNRLSHTMEGQEMEPVLVTILPHQEIAGVTPCPHVGEEFVYVLEGILTVFIGNEEYQLYPGDSMHYKSTIPHEWVNYTGKLVRILSVNTPLIFKGK